ncbi:MAG TPA: hypothetical protein VF070_26510 [Streptosporangiaceae bacterium]
MRDARPAADNVVGTLRRAVTAEELVLQLHVIQPQISSFFAVPGDTATEPFLRRGLDPQREGEVPGDLAAG